jgi:branched-chain amino acid aminotransferase
MPVMAKASGIYLNSVIALREARLEGYDEAILLDWRGYVAEGSGENVFIVRRGVIATPPTTASILEGITRDTVIRIARDEGYMVEERDITREELLTADEVFFTGTAAEITPVLEVDGRPVGEGKPGPITMKLKERYQRIVMGLEERYKHWLTPVY